MTRLFGLALRRPLAALAAALLLAVPAAWLAARLKVDSSTEMFFAENDPDRAIYQRFVDQFGSDELMFVMVDTGGNNEALPAADALANSLAAIKGVSGLFNPVDKYRTMAAGTADGAPDYAAIRKIVEANPYERDAPLISFNKHYLTFVLKVADAAPGERGEIFTLTRRLLEKKGFGPERVTIAGQPVLNHYLGETPKEVGKVFFPILLVITAGLLFFLFRDWRLILAPLLLIGFVEVFVFGMIDLFGEPLNIITAIVPVLLFIVTLAASIHILEQFAATWHEGVDAKDALLATLRDKFWPSAFALATTATGFGSLAWSHIAPIKHLGLYMAYGCGVAFVALFGVFPAIVILLAKKRHEIPPLDLSPFYHRIIGFARAWAWPIILMALLPVAYTAWRLPGIEFQTNGLLYFDETSYIRTATRHFEEMGLGMTSMEIVLEGRPDDFADPQRLARLDELTGELRAIPGVQSAYSTSSLLREIHGIFSGDYALPPGFIIGQIFQTAAAAYPGMLYAYTDREYSRARISVGMKTIGLGEYRAIRERVDAALAKSPLPGAAKASVTGQFPLILNVQRDLMDTLTSSFLSSFLTILACFVLLLRSIKLALLAMIPNVIPVFIIVSFMFLSGIKFDIGNIMIASVVLGIAVDDTAHFLYQIKTHRHKENLTEILWEAFDGTGAAIFYTTVILTAGFAVFAFSGFLPTRHFGILAAMAIAFALLCDLLLLPAVMFVMKYRPEQKGELP